MNDVQRFGPYRVLRDIGEGGMGRVSLAEREGWEEPVVLKRIHPEHAANARFRRRLLREAKVAAGLHHLNVVRVLETGVIDDQVYLSMEYVAGSSLAHVHAASRPELLPLGPILDAVAQACDGAAVTVRAGPVAQVGGLVRSGKPHRRGGLVMERISSRRRRRPTGIGIPCACSCPPRRSRRGSWTAQ
ncbi:protein kinase domain-containing protein [Corallococcus caeni]|uniref:Protein kinase domain-containing protein n=1 Tax=Corallococcus caeni TaxID=3082388 RepID=A0ABQ6QV84_9BACT|nr:hypothetical protein ASNO1_40000 [Corallococcus sp. NO1]